MAKHPVPFSLSAVLLAPLVIPVLFGVLLGGGNQHPIAAFAISTLLGYIFTLGVVGGLLLPAFWLVSRFTRITKWRAPVIGGLLAVPVFLAWDYSNWSSSGVDSGPAPTTYSQWLVKSWFTPEPLFVISFGIVTAAAYYFLATRKPRQSSRPSPSRD